MRPKSKPAGFALVETVVRRLLCDGDIVHVALAETGTRNTPESRLLVHIFERRIAGIAHRCL